MFRLPSGVRVERRFRNRDSLQLLYDYVDTLPEMESIVAFDLYSSFPRQSYSEKKHITLMEANLVPSGMIVIEEQIED
jgi:hypothetical protein